MQLIYYITAIIEAIISIILNEPPRFIREFHALFVDFRTFLHIEPFFWFLHRKILQLSFQIYFSEYRSNYKE